MKRSRLISKPSRASLIEGWNRSSHGRRPCLLWIASSPRSSPGTRTDRPPTCVETSGSTEKRVALILAWRKRSARMRQSASASASAARSSSDAPALLRGSQRTRTSRPASVQGRNHSHLEQGTNAGVSVRNQLGRTACGLRRRATGQGKAASSTPPVPRWLASHHLHPALRPDARDDTRTQARVVRRDRADAGDHADEGVGCAAALRQEGRADVAAELDLARGRARKEIGRWRWWW